MTGCPAPILPLRGGGYGERAGVEAGDLLFPFVRACVRALVGLVSGTSHTRTPAFPCWTAGTWMVSRLSVTWRSGRWPSRRSSACLG